MSPAPRPGAGDMADGYPITCAVDGRQYVAFGAGGPPGGSIRTSVIPADPIPEKRNPRSGNAIFAFAVPDGE